MLHLLPVPESLVMGEETFTITPDSYIILSPRAGEVMRTAARQLKEEVRAACGLSLRVSIGKARKGDIILAASDAAPQSYTLAIEAEGITICGDEAGVLHGVQTLRQIIRQCGASVPCLDITDAPLFPVRGFYHDQTRGRIATLDGLKALADTMCLYKMNQLQLYVEHTYLFRDLPGLWPVAVTPLTAEDIMALDDYCLARGIELVPSLSCFGHLYELLRLKQFAPLCELEAADSYAAVMHDRMHHHTIDPTDEGAFPLVAAMIDEFLPLFRSDKFNICCDETFDLGKGKNQGKDVRRLYMDFLKKLCAHVAQQGSTPMFWGDIVLKHPEVLTELPEGAICLNWNYSPDAKEDGARAFHQAGAVQYVCPGVDSWDWWLPRMTIGYENIRLMAEHGSKYGAAGLLNTDWGDYGHIDDPRFSLPGMVTGACASWGNLPEQNALEAALSRMEYGDASGRVVTLLSELSDAQEHLGWRRLVDFKEQQQGTLKPHENSLRPISEEQLAQVDAIVKRTTEELRTLAPTLPASQQGMVCNWLIAAEAIFLWNHIQHCTCSGLKDGELADRLLRWLPRYEAMWHETSRESELWRIRDVASWYAAYLKT